MTASKGLEDDRQPALWPADSINSLLIRNEPRTVHDVLRRINAGRYVMNPDFPARLHLGRREAKQAHRVRHHADSASRCFTLPKMKKGG